MKKFKKIISLIMVVAVIASICVIGTVNSGAAATGAGLAEWALRAYNEGWSYVWGGTSVGAVDCSGLIWSYCGGNRTSMLSDAQENGRDWGYVSSGIPRVHGLGLSRPGHVGVYIADNMEVDARGSDYGVCYQEIGGWNGWDCWFKLTAVSYPENGWEEFNGDSYYYENGEYIVNTTRTIDGVTYSFDSTGRCDEDVDASSSSSSSSSSETPGSSSSSNDNGPLKKGSSGSLVEKLQQRLQELGYYTAAVDGDFGEMTEKAFKAFQQNAGLYVDGIAGSDAEYLYSDDAPAYKEEKADDSTEAETTAEEDKLTAKAEDEEVADTGVVADLAPETQEQTAESTELVYAVGDSGEDVAKIQNRLISLNYLEGEADGDFGNATEEAVKGFQLGNDLAATGVIEQTTYDVLFSDSAVAAEKEEPATPDKEDDKAAGTTTANSPAESGVKAPASTPTAPNTDVEVKTAELSSKSVAAVAESPLFKQSANGTNFEFIIWLGIMIVVMLIAFTIVYVVEKKKQKANQGRRYQ